MRVIKCKNYEEFSTKAADLVAAQVRLKPNGVIGLLTGSTGLGMYDNLAAMDLDFSEITTFNLDEYLGLEPTNDQSYYYFMNKNLYSRVNLKPENTNIPKGIADDIEKMAQEYDEKIDAKGGIDLMVLGIGGNGHIGFNEPDSELVAGTHVVDLTPETIEANSRFFESIDDVPTQAVTMGIGSILKAKHILLLAGGKNKEKAVRQLLEGKITTQNPSTMLLAHPNVTVLIDCDNVKL